MKDPLANTEKSAKKAVPHAHCFVCGACNEQGMKLTFERAVDGSVVGRFGCDPCFQGYEGFLHGGVISSLLDSAMTNCLFAQGKAAVTGKLTVRFLVLVAVNREVIIRARIHSSYPPLYLMESDMTQDGRIVARATAKFMETQL